MSQKNNKTDMNAIDPPEGLKKINTNSRPPPIPKKSSISDEDDAITPKGNNKSTPNLTVKTDSNSYNPATDEPFYVTLDEIKDYCLSFSVLSGFKGKVVKADLQKRCLDENDKNILKTLWPICDPEDKKCLDLFKFFCYSHIRHVVTELNVDMPDEIPPYLMSLKKAIPKFHAHLICLKDIDAQINNLKKEMEQLEEDRSIVDNTLKNMSMKYLDKQEIDVLPLDETDSRPEASSCRSMKMPEKSFTQNRSNSMTFSEDMSKKNVVVLPKSRKEKVTQMNFAQRYSPLLKSTKSDSPRNRKSITKKSSSVSTKKV